MPEANANDTTPEAFQMLFDAYDNWKMQQIPDLFRRQQPQAVAQGPDPSYPAEPAQPQEGENEFEAPQGGSGGGNGPAQTAAQALVLAQALGIGDQRNAYERLFGPREGHFYTQQSKIAESAPLYGTLAYDPNVAPLFDPANWTLGAVPTNGGGALASKTGQYGVQKGIVPANQNLMNDIATYLIGLIGGA